ncbi:hypothetical protein RUM43_006306 [Polyplax serrata]|uniref:CDP-diacylglycerol--glycerol-3-phosphate 3-phosphatidyltransferase n=1 Tax=Polyplax serrata TaxID=468196 RepID=A0AAN8NXM0_POLSC
MGEFWNVLDMANNIANQIWKHSFMQNAAPAVACESLNGTFLHKLGISWIPNQAPAFYINSKQAKQINKANNRIVLSSLYLGTGHLEKDLVQAIQKRLSEKPNLVVKILLDCTRGSRGQSTSRQMVLPLLANHSDSCSVSLYQTASLQGPLTALLPTKYKEIVGLHHIKIYAFDDNFIITGANLSTDYFTNRQDRYMFIKGSQELTDFVEGLVDKISEFSFHLNSNNTLTLGDNCPPLKDKKNFNFAASSAIRNYYDSFIGKGKIGDEDTVIFPLLEMGPFGIHTDSTITTKILEQYQEDAQVFLTTGYFNLTNSYIDTIIDKSKAKYKILMAHPMANGFYKAKFPAGGIPDAYTYLASSFLKQIIRHKQTNRIKIFEYKRPNWTYHAKGLWVNTEEIELPFITMVGSPNFGERSVNHDLECQFLLATADEKLQCDLYEERKLLYSKSHTFSEKVWNNPDRKIPAWVKVVVLFFRSYL